MPASFEKVEGPNLNTPIFNVSLNSEVAISYPTIRSSKTCEIELVAGLVPSSGVADSWNSKRLLGICVNVAPCAAVAAEPVTVNVSRTASKFLAGLILELSAIPT